MAVPVHVSPVWESYRQCPQSTEKGERALAGSEVGQGLCVLGKEPRPEDVGRLLRGTGSLAWRMSGLKLPRAGDWKSWGLEGDLEKMRMWQGSHLLVSSRLFVFAAPLQVSQGQEREDISVNSLPRALEQSTLNLSCSVVAVETVSGELTRC